jgi:thiamine biosynthesis lipoprotein
VAACLLAAGASASGGDRPLAQAREYLMGTIAEVRVHAGPDADGAARAVAAAFDELRAIDRLMAVQRPESDVSRLNREGARGPVPVDTRVIEVLERSLALWKMTDGAFDPTVLPLARAWGFTEGRPHRPEGPPPAVSGAGAIRVDREARTVALDDPRAAVDLGGVAKGYALDRARAVLRAHGVTSAYVDLGGNVATMGAAPDGPYWRIGIRHPRRDGALLGVLEVGATTVSTSGDAEQFVEVDGERFGHVFDPRTGRPARGAVSVTVVHDDGALGDGLSTASVVLGEAAARPMLAGAGAQAVFARLAADGGIDISTTTHVRFARVEGPRVPAPRGESDR